MSTPEIPWGQTMRTLTTRLLITTMALTAIVCLPVAAGDLNVRWNPSAEATGYRLHFGTSPSQYDTSIDVGDATETNLDTLTDCTMWYFAATAYNVAGESGYSTEIASWPQAWRG